jgi:hypothetical protein
MISEFMWSLKMAVSLSPGERYLPVAEGARRGFLQADDPTMDAWAMINDMGTIVGRAASWE